MQSDFTAYQTTSDYQYCPGSATAYFGFGPLLITGSYYILHTSIIIKNLIWAIIILFVMLVGMIVIPEDLLKRKDTNYPFQSAGYYEKFIK